MLHYPGSYTISAERSAHAYVVVQTALGGYSVTYPRFWVQESTGLPYDHQDRLDNRLSDCPDGGEENPACKVVAIKPDLQRRFGSAQPPKEAGWYLREDGTVGSKQSFFLVVDLTGSLLRKDEGAYSSLIRNKIAQFRGKEIRQAEDETIIAVFTAAREVIRCAVEIHTHIAKIEGSHTAEEDHPSFSISIAGVHPGSVNEKTVADTIKRSQRLSTIARNQQIIVTDYVARMSALRNILDRESAIRTINASEEEFFLRLSDRVEDKLDQENFSVVSLARHLGLSRTQLFRKMKSLTGYSPNEFIRSMRMKKAFALLRKKQYNISEIALAVGINNPSYFTKCFQQKFGIIPSQFMSLRNSG